MRKTATDERDATSTIDLTSSSFAVHDARIRHKLSLEVDQIALHCIAAQTHTHKGSQTEIPQN